ncbi:putative DnaJ domain, Chaperone J-domain superfamily [Dioscorea sansibarensis]
MLILSNLVLAFFNCVDKSTIVSYLCRSFESCCLSFTATPFLAGLAVAAAALAGRYSIHAWQAYKARPVVPRMRKFYEGGFQPSMTRREAALILGIRENATPDKVREAHRKVMVANHPDAGGSHYLASKINEAKDVLLGKTKGGGSAF